MKNVPPLDARGSEDGQGPGHGWMKLTINIDISRLELLSYLAGVHVKQKNPTPSYYFNILFQTRTGGEGKLTPRTREKNPRKRTLFVSSSKTPIPPFFIVTSLGVWCRFVFLSCVPVCSIDYY